jgi:hypothetical protein
MLFGQMISCWRPLHWQPRLRLAGAITAGVGIMLWALFPKAPPSPVDLSGLFVLVVTVSLGARWSLGQARRLRKAVVFFRPYRSRPEPRP